MTILKGKKQWEVVKKKEYLDLKRIKDKEDGEKKPQAQDIPASKPSEAAAEEGTGFIKLDGKAPRKEKTETQPKSEEEKALELAVSRNKEWKRLGNDFL
jgi:hypothetical protein